jgi:hypothetical protein
MNVTPYVIWASLILFFHKWVRQDDSLAFYKYKVCPYKKPTSHRSGVAEKRIVLGFQSQLCYCSAVWPWGSLLRSRRASMYTIELSEYVLNALVVDEILWSFWSWRANRQHESQSRREIKEFIWLTLCSTIDCCGLDVWLNVDQRLKLVYLDSGV